VAGKIGQAGSLQNGAPFRAAGDYQQNRQVVNRARDAGQQCLRQRIHPLDIFQDQDHRTMRGGNLQAFHKERLARLLTHSRVQPFGQRRVG
jgi:hypothetical protein